ncbi:MAG: MBL fold metallo-hydrolase [Melioribacteraceae bacterium]|nr:MBL fold metallo-hydrolase [Melioribacteraceae bacterium]MCF8395115.1 MBL fold metallo-hydrolase [Melioribacteraceae bacterium]MCF8420524.1 MBL fold metallo-hydrolase [Melioribacteraceae bacterium]
MFFKNIYENGLAQASYLVGCQATGDAIVIDPRRDIDIYLEIAEKENLRITHITETHIHADFLSGSRELQAVTGAKVLLSDEGGNDWQYQFDHTGLHDGDTFKVGNLKFDVIHTPGHTPEHISFLLTDTAASSKPIMIFTGDFVFVGDVGRPDLLEAAAGYKGTREIGAADMYESLKKFTALPDYVQVWAGHGAGSACGKALGAVPSSTVGYEKLVNWALQIDDKDEFIKQLLDGQPEPPKYFAMMKKLNKVGPEILGGIPHPARMNLTQFKSAVDKNIMIVDTRDKLSFAGGHVPGSLNIQDNTAFSTWAGWMLNYDEPFLLIAPEHRIEELIKKLIRIGFDNVYGYLPDMDAWANTGYELEVLDQITCSELVKKMERNNTQVIDVRGEAEFNSGNIERAENIHVGYLKENIDRLDKNKDIVVHCASGDRSSIAASYLKSIGFNNVINLTGGYSAWINECGKKSNQNELAVN